MRIKGQLARILPLIILVFLLGSIPLVLSLAKRVQDLRKRAFVEQGGVASVSLSPVEDTRTVGEEFPVHVQLNTGDEVVSTISIALYYAYNSEKPVLKVASAPRLSDEMDGIGWSCTNFGDSEYCQGENQDWCTDKKVPLRFMCNMPPTQGYSTNGEIKNFVTFTFRADEMPLDQDNPTVVQFDLSDPELNGVWTKDGAIDVLQRPEATGTYSIVVGPTSTPTPTEEATPTPTVTPTVTSTPTPTVTPIPDACRYDIINDCEKKGIGDADCDFDEEKGQYDIDAFDLSIWLHSQCPSIEDRGAGQYCSDLRADFDKDCDVDEDDYRTWFDNQEEIQD